jgi:hypothetical protein
LFQIRRGLGLPSPKASIPPSSSHPIARGGAGSMLLAHMLFAKYCLHLRSYFDFA